MYDLWIFLAIVLYYLVKWYLIIAGLTYILIAARDAIRYFPLKEKGDKLVIIIALLLGIFFVAVGVFVF